MLYAIQQSCRPHSSRMHGLIELIANCVITTSAFLAWFGKSVRLRFNRAKQ